MQKEFVFRIVLTFMWVFLWESFDIVQFALGFLLATAVTKFFAHMRHAQGPTAPPETVIGR